jgi:hypothetical protein
MEAPGVPNPFAGQLQKTNAGGSTSALVPNDLVDMGIVVEEGEALRVPTTIPLTLSNNTYQQTIAGHHFVRRGTEFLAGALNGAMGLIQAADSNWQERPTPGGTPFLPFTNERPETLGNTVCDEGSVIAIVDVTDEYVDAAVMRARHRRYRALNPVSQTGNQDMEL